eukprot:gene7945-13835_t
MDGCPTLVVDGCPTLVVDGCPTLVVDGCPTLVVDGCPTLVVDGCPTLVVDGCPTLVVDGCPTLVVDGCPTLVVDGCPTLVVDGCPTLVVDGCSTLVVDGCPTLANPIPTLHLGYEAARKKPGRALIRVETEEKPELSEAPANPEKMRYRGLPESIPTWGVFSCGHSFHLQCLLPALSTCFTCKNHSVFDTNGPGEASNNGTDFSNAESEDSAQDHDVPGNLEGYNADRKNELGLQKKLEREIENYNKPSGPDQAPECQLNVTYKASDGNFSKSLEEIFKAKPAFLSVHPLFADGYTPGTVKKQFLSLFTELYDPNGETLLFEDLLQRCKLEADEITQLQKIK